MGCRQPSFAHQDGALSHRCPHQYYRPHHRGRSASRLTATDRANGFANRFLYVCADRSKLLPDGGTLADETVTALAVQVYSALSGARDIGRLTRTPSAAKL